ncbi:MAG: TetR family transcriptional regulator [Alphaproteobacteria bacterium]|nr:TetR family transcriptional regulator [Alphaproteobacteria bacterium]
MRRTKQDAQKTYDAILNASAALFAEKCISNVSLEEIAKAANVTRGAIYWHFKNKGEIFNALHESVFQPLSEIILQDLHSEEEAPLQLLSNLCVKLLLDITQDTSKRQMMTLFLLHWNYTGDIAKYKEPHLAKKEESLQLFAKYFEKAKADGTLPECADPMFLTISVRCYLKGIIIEYLNNPESIDLEKNAEHLIVQFFRQFNV